MSSPSNFATPSQTQTRTKAPNTSQSPSASKGIPSPVDVAEVVSLQFRNIPMTGSFPFSESTVGSALRQALACYLSTPTSSLAVGSVLIDSVQLASTGALLGERFKPGQAANLAPARPGCLAPSLSPPARRLTEELIDAATPAAVPAGGRGLQATNEPLPSPRSDLVVNVVLTVTMPARDGAFANSQRRDLILAAKETPEGRAALSRFLLVCGFYDALAAYDPGMPVTALADAGTFVAATWVQPSSAPVSSPTQMLTPPISSPARNSTNSTYATPSPLLATPTQTPAFNCGSLSAGSGFFRFFPRMDLVGILISADVYNAPIETACNVACCNLGALCHGYSFDASLGRITGRSVCSLYSNITQLIPNSNVVSGISTSVL